MPNTLIHSNSENKKEKQKENLYIDVAEFFFDTIQGEGISAGVPAAFLRLQNCTLNCVWCDTTEVWRKGNPYGNQELLELMRVSGLVEKLRQGQHLVLTGGSPLKQQERLVDLLQVFQLSFGFKPYVEVENECVLRVLPQFAELVDQWNNSPKLSNSEMRERVRYRPAVIAHTAKLQNSWFKFVVSSEEDWEEIEKDFLPLISKRQVLLMPQGQTREELDKSREIAVNLAVKHGVRFTDRLHVTVWDKKTGV